MKHRISPTALIVCVTLFFSLAGTAVANPTIPLPTAHSRLYVPSVTFTVREDHTAQACSRNIPASWTVAVWVYVNGREIHSTIVGNLYYAGDGTLVKAWALPGDGPACARAMTWLRSARVRLVFRVL